MNDKELAPINVELVTAEEAEDIPVVARIERGKLSNFLEGAGTALNLTSDILEAVESSKLYRVKVPDGYSLKDLVPSKEGGGAVRALVRGNKKHLNGNVSLKANGITPLQIANIGMSAAAMVVGQAYMAEISDSLSEIDKKLDTVTAMMVDEKKATVTNALDIANRYFKHYDEYQQKPSTALQSVRNELEHRYNDVGVVIDWLCGQLAPLAEKARTAKSKDKDISPLIKELHSYEDQFSLCLQALSALAMTMMYYDGTMDEESMLAEQRYILEKSQSFLEARQPIAGILEIKIGALKRTPIALPQKTDENGNKRLVLQTPRAAARRQLLDTKKSMQADLRGAQSRITAETTICQNNIEKIASASKASKTILTDGTSCWLISDRFNSQIRTEKEAVQLGKESS